MSQIQINHLTFGYEASDTLVFEDVSICLDTNWRLGLIGRNGRGKTTLLRLLLGGLAYQGTMTADTVFDYFPFEVADETLSALETARACVAPFVQWEREMESALEMNDTERYMSIQELYALRGGYEIDEQLARETGKLGLSPEALQRPFASLSGGEKTKLLIAALFLRKGHFLLIDEPTNHLDTAGRKLLARYLTAKTGFILVSHDRAFLDGAVDHILSINRSDIEVQRGNYSSFDENRKRRESFELSEQDRLKKDVVRLRKAAEQRAGWSDQVEKSKIGTHAADRGAIGHKAAKMMKRAKSIAARRETAVVEKEALLQNSEETPPLKITVLDAPKVKLFEAENLIVDFGGRALLGGMRLEVNRGERVALLGANGCGKSSVLKLGAGESVPFTGTVRRMSGLVVSYVPQDTSFLKGSLKEFAEREGVEEHLFKAILRKLGFSRAQFEEDMARCSDGQKKKILIARSLSQRAHLYIWDEPLNYVDLESREQIEQLLTAYQPTMLLVEHDAIFVQRVATKTILLE